MSSKIKAKVDLFSPRGHEERGSLRIRSDTRLTSNPRATKERTGSRKAICRLDYSCTSLWWMTVYQYFFFQRLLFLHIQGDFLFSPTVPYRQRDFAFRINVSTERKRVVDFDSDAMAKIVSFYSIHRRKAQFHFPDHDLTRQWSLHLTSSPFLFTIDTKDTQLETLGLLPAWKRRMIWFLPLIDLCVL